MFSNGLRNGSPSFHRSHIHMDIKIANFLVNDNRDLIVIDWEQSGAPVNTLAREADGSWDIRDARIGTVGSTDSDFVYEKCTGHHREKFAHGRPKWNLLPLGRDRYPRALEAAEVFSLGHTMWMLLKELTQEELAGLDDVVVSWSENAKDIPDEWRTVVNGCLNPDINGGLDCWSSWLSGNHVVIEHVPPLFAHQSHSGGFDLSF